MSERIDYCTKCSKKIMTEPASFEHADPILCMDCLVNYSPSNYNVYSKVDRGEGTNPRFIPGKINLFPITLIEAINKGESESRQRHICEVEIREATSDKLVRKIK